MKCSVLCLLVLSAAAQAEVVRSDAQGFQIRIETDIQAPPMAVYKQFLKVGEWWNDEHTWFGDAAGLSIKARAGGCFCEKNGRREAVHMTVSYVDPGKEVRLIGGLGPLQMMGIHGGMSWTFTANENGGTRVVQQYQVTGSIAGGMQALAPVVDQVQSIQQNGLAARFD